MTCVDLTVGVTVEVRHRCASGAVHHVVDQVLLVCETIDGVLVFHHTSQIGHSHTVDAVAVVVCHGVVHVVRTPAAPWACHKHVVKFGGTCHVHIEGHTHLAVATTGVASVARHAAVVANHSRVGSAFSHVPHAVDEFSRCSCALFRAVENLSLGPVAVAQELVLLSAWLERQRDGVNAVSIGIVHEVGSVVPTVGRASPRDRSVPGAVDIHRERHIHCGHSHNVVVASAVASAVRVVGRAVRLNLTVGITSKVGHGCARSTIHHVVDQVFLIGKTVDGVLVLHEACQIGHSHGIDAITVRVGHGVVRVVRTPAAPWARDEDICEALRGTRHVDVEGCLCLKAKAEHGTCKHEIITHERKVFRVEQRIEFSTNWLKNGTRTHFPQITNIGN